MLYTPMTCAAMKLAYQAHHGQTDMAGLPYFHHPMHLAEKTGDEEELIAAALLHDVIEDTCLTYGDLEAAGISPPVLEAVRLLTHEDGVPYMDYVAKIASSKNRTAILVKLEDLRHNSDVTRLAEAGPGDAARVGVYAAARGLLEAALGDL